MSLPKPAPLSPAHHSHKSTLASRQDKIPYASVAPKSDVRKSGRHDTSTRPQRSTLALRWKSEYGFLLKRSVYELRPKNPTEAKHDARQTSIGRKIGTSHRNLKCEGFPGILRLWGSQIFRHHARPTNSTAAIAQNEDASSQPPFPSTSSK